jgi:AraC-like DNA-binding protein
LLGVPADELVDQLVPFDDVRNEASDLSAQLADAPRPNAALQVLQLDLLRRQARMPPPDSLVVEAVRRLMPWRPTGIGLLTEDLAISESQLRRRFLAEVGIGPKTLQRTLRFQGYLALAQRAADRPDSARAARRRGRPVRLRARPCGVVRAVPGRSPAGRADGLRALVPFKPEMPTWS